MAAATSIRTPVRLAAALSLASCAQALAQQGAAGDLGEDPIQTATVDSADPTEDFGFTQRGRREAEPEEPAVPEVEASPFHITLQLDYVTAYYSRGFRYEDRGFILQPSLELGLDLHESETCTFGVFAGSWNSFHDRATDAPQNDDFIDKWYEADLYAGVGGSVGNVGYSVSYLAYTSPSDAWETIEEIVIDLEYDDSEWWGESGFTLTPSLSFTWEVGSNYNDGADTDRGYYLQPGITPAFTVEEVPLVDTIDFSFPITVGVSLGNFYEDAEGHDNPFGFVSFTSKAEIPLPVPASLGRWSLSGSVQLLILGETTSEFNDDEDTALIGSVGLTIEF